MFNSFSGTAHRKYEFFISVIILACLIAKLQKVNKTFLDLFTADPRIYSIGETVRFRKSFYISIHVEMSFLFDQSAIVVLRVNNKKMTGCEPASVKPVYNKNRMIQFPNLIYVNIFRYTTKQNIEYTFGCYFMKSKFL